MKYLLMFMIFNSKTIIGNAELGKPAPNFSLPSHENKNVELASYLGKWVVLEWYNKDCPFVRKHYDSKNMQKLQKEYSEKGVAWLSIVSSKKGSQGYLEAPEAAEQLKKEGSFAQKILLDTDGKTGKLFGAKTTPHIYIINPKGELVYQGAIDDTPSSDASDIVTAKNYVRTSLDLAMAGKKIEEPQTRAYGCSVKY